MVDDIDCHLDEFARLIGYHNRYLCSRCSADVGRAGRHKPIHQIVGGPNVYNAVDPLEINSACRLNHNSGFCIDYRIDTVIESM